MRTRATPLPPPSPIQVLGARLAAGGAMHAGARAHDAQEPARAAARQEIVVDSILPAARSRFAVDADGAVRDGS